MAAKYYAKGNYRIALLFSNKAAELAPSSANARYNRALCHFKLHCEKKAMEEAGEGNPRTINAGGEGEEEVPQELAGAMRDVESAIRLNPDFAEAYFLRASIYEEFNFYVFARRDYEAVSRLRPPLLEGDGPEGWGDVPTGPIPSWAPGPLGLEGAPERVCAGRGNAKGSPGIKAACAIAAAIALAIALSLAAERCQSGPRSKGARPEPGFQMEGQGEGAQHGRRFRADEPGEGEWTLPQRDAVFDKRFPRNGGMHGSRPQKEGAFGRGRVQGLHTAARPRAQFAAPRILK